MSRKTSEGEAEAVKEKRDRVGHPTADRPNSLLTTHVCGVQVLEF